MSFFKKKDTGPKEIRETKCTCTVCGNVWHYGKEEEARNTVAKMNQTGKAMMCCGGCLPALFIPNQQIVDLNKCPKCGSKAVKKEVVIHHV
jgi:DNA-directed RNA polymerase subunit M/transcription elongation factor TFIIS